MGLTERLKRPATAAAVVSLVVALAAGSAVFGRQAVSVERAQEREPGMEVPGQEPELLHGVRLRQVLATLGPENLEAPQPLLPPGLKRYVVGQGDTLWDIAANLGASVEQITASNTLERGDLISPGKELIVPIVPGFAYRIKDGDTLSSLATRYSIEADSIQTANGIAPDQALLPGTIVLLPGARPPAADKVRVASASRSLSSGRNTGAWAWPARGPITSGFGTRWGSFHEGIDIGVGTGTAVHASRSGRVTRAGWDGGYGKVVMISHGGGLTTVYAHLSQLEVSVGEQVDQGQVVGLSGSTGNSTGPHLHFEVRVNGTQKNPLSYLP